MSSTNKGSGGRTYGRPRTELERSVLTSCGMNCEQRRMKRRNKYVEVRITMLKQNKEENLNIFKMVHQWQKLKNSKSRFVIQLKIKHDVLCSPPLELFQRSDIFDQRRSPYRGTICKYGNNQRQVELSLYMSRGCSSREDSLNHPQCIVSLLEDSVNLGRPGECVCKNNKVLQFVDGLQFALSTSFGQYFKIKTKGQKIKVPMENMKREARVWKNFSHKEKQVI